MTDSRRLQAKARSHYERYGQTKPMGESAPSPTQPHYFLLRTFRAENDLLTIFNTKRCRYQCHFCQLPAKSTRVFVPTEDILAQFEYVIDEVKHAVSTLDRVTLSNEGSVLDEATFPADALLTIASCVNEFRRVRRLVLETRLEFAKEVSILAIKNVAGRATVDILTGFETLDTEIRDRILGKREPLSVFLAGLDQIASAGADLTAYVLFKPSPCMTDEEAKVECERSIDFLAEECDRRRIGLTIRLNPMYRAAGSKWAQMAESSETYRPPRLTDVMDVAAKKSAQGISIYIGLSTEGLDEDGGTYASREDYSAAMVRPIKLFNDAKIASFEERE